MSSILTNNSAMVALQTLKSINSGLAKTQDMISTGKKVATAKDNSAIWSVSKVMEADASNFQAVSDSLGLAEAVVGTGLKGANDIVTAIKDMMKVATQAGTDGLSFEKAEENIQALEAAVESIVYSSQNNGINLLTTDVDGLGGGTMTVLSSINRSGANTADNSNPPTVSTITIAGVNFQAEVEESSRTEITSAATAQTALSELEALYQFAVDAAADLGTASMRIETQKNFTDNLIDSMKSGMGALVDANMEEASARLQALQVQQQLATQSLSIANQAPQNILALFRN